MRKIKNWGPFLFIAGYHVLLLALLPAYIAHFSWLSLLLALIVYILGGVSITAGYHRLFSHRSYQAHPWLERIVLVLSTLAFQASALVWSHDHRLHHKHVDTDEDPYSIEKGFWYAHLGWIFTQERTFRPEVVRDLERNPRVMFQYRHFTSLTIATNAIVIGLACLLVHPVAAFYAVFLLRVFAIHHCTWFINSLAHTWGARTYVRELSAVDNAVLAVLTFGEGYHNYHHAFASDYRNGIRWYHYDITKWVIWLASKIGWARDLRSVSDLRIRQQLVRKDRELFLRSITDDHPQLKQLRQRVERLSASFDEGAAELARHMQRLRSESRKRQNQFQDEVHHLQEEVHELQERVRREWKEWKRLARQVSRTGLLPAH